MRTNYLIKLRLQIKFALMVFCILVAVALLILIQSDMYGDKLMMSGALSHEGTATALRILHGMMVRTFLLGLAVTFALTLFFSHFVAGPIYRFEQTLGGLKQGRLDLHVQLRKYDELKDTADLFNQALSSLRQRLRKEREEVSEIADKIGSSANKLKKAGRTEEAKELLKLVANIKNNPTHIQI